MSVKAKFPVGIELNGDNDNKRETYPIKTYKSVEAFIGNIYKRYGDVEILSNQKIADVNNLSPNSIKQILSTCQQYGCLQNVHGKGYKITDIFTKIFHPENEEERVSAIIECIKNVRFYIPLFNDYNEKVVPSIDGLQNRFIREFKMKPHIAKNAAEIFLQNLKDFNLINQRNILIFRNEFRSSFTQAENSTTEPINQSSAGVKSSNKITKDNSDEEQVKIPIRLKENRMAYLSFPNDFTDEDLRKIFRVVKAYIEAYGDNINLDEK